MKDGSRPAAVSMRSGPIPRPIVERRTAARDEKGQELSARPGKHHRDGMS